MARRVGWSLAIAGALAVVTVLVWTAIVAHGAPDPMSALASTGSATVDIGVLVFREGLECILVLAAITASMTGDDHHHRRPVIVGAVAGFVASVITWFAVVGVLQRLSQNLPALVIQAATGLVAIIVLLMVMNWFFHRVYWTGWISLHTKRKHRLIDEDAEHRSRARLLWGLAMLGFTALYREGFEVVLFLQSYRLQLGGRVVLGGFVAGLVLTVIAGTLTFVGQRRLPYKKMLIVTGVLLGAVLLVMVGEEAQEMQLAHWIPTTTIPSLARLLPDWIGLWFSVFPTAESLAAQAVAATLVIGSYMVAQRGITRARAAQPS